MSTKIHYVIVLLVTGTIVSGCSCNLHSPEHRLDVSFDAAPQAYRNTGNASEDLSIPIRIRNLSSDNLCIHQGTSSNAGAEGLALVVQLVRDNPYISEKDATIDYAFSAGGRMTRMADAQRRLFTDKHNSAVDRLAMDAPPILGLDEDGIRTGFRLQGNEALVRAEFPVNWETVPRSPLVIETGVAIEVRLFYEVRREGTLEFSEVFRHRVRAALVNSVRGTRDFRPGANSPQTGKFSPPSP